MLGGAFAAFAASAGLMHSYAVFLVAFIEEFRWSRAETSVAYSVSQLVAGASSPLVGALVDRLGPRRLLLLGGSLLVLGLLASAFISALWQIILLYGVVMTVGANCLGLVVFVPLLSRHFVRRRGMAISIVQSANGFGRAASAPLVQLLISSLGWRETYLAQSAFMAAVVPLLASLFRRAARSPVAAEHSAIPDSSAPASLPSPEWSLGAAVRTPHFWLLFAVSCSPASGAFWSRCTSSPLPSTAASTSSMRPGCSASAAFSPSPGRSSPGRCRIILDGNCRPSSPTAFRSSASSARC